MICFQCLWIRYGIMRCVKHYILLLFRFHTLSQLFWDLLYHMWDAEVVIVFFPSTVWRKLVQVRWYKNKKQKREWQAPWDDCCFGVVQIKWNWIERKKGRGCGHRLNKRGELLNESSFRVFTDTSTDWGLVNSCIPCVTVRQCITTLLKMMGYQLVNWLTWTSVVFYFIFLC